MYFYGLGNGILYKALLKNETHQKIIVVEPEIEIIYAVLNLIDLSDELSSERLTLFYSEFANYTAGALSVYVAKPACGARY